MPVKSTPAVDRVLARVTENDEGCWVFTGALTKQGYGVVQLGRGIGTAKAHRVVYEAFVGPITAETLDHLCYTPACCNPGHLEPVSRSENVTRQAAAGRSVAADHRAKTHCPQGHSYSGSNLYVSPTNRRECRICRRAAQRRYEARHLASD